MTVDPARGLDSYADRTRRSVASLLLPATLIAAACSSGETADGTTTSSTSTASSTTETPAATGAPSVTSLDDQITWVLALLNGESATSGEVAERFTDDFLAQVPPEQLLALTEQLRVDVAESWVQSGIEGDGSGAEVRLTTGSGPWLMLIAVDRAGLIETLLLQPDATDEPPESFDELVEQLGAAGDVALLAADVSDGTCQPVHAEDASVPIPIGSDFKLYVLGALVDAVAAGDVAWDDALVISDDLKSLPSGTFQDLDDGTERTVQEFAEMMIAISDNTATDHLIDLLGRERVQAAQAVYGHSDPGLNVPFLTTRELFVLKLVFDQAERDEYIAADPDERRRILETDVAERAVSLEDAGGWTSPRNVQELEWFASPLDLCLAMVELQANATDPAGAPIRAILSANPGTAVDGNIWSYVGFKGGSEPGVLSLAWYLEGAPGAFVYVVSVTNTETVIPELQVVTLAAIGFDLLAGL